MLDLTSLAESVYKREIYYGLVNKKDGRFFRASIKDLESYGKKGFPKEMEEEYGKYEDCLFFGGINNKQNYMIRLNFLDELKLPRDKRAEGEAAAEQTTKFASFLKKNGLAGKFEDYLKEQAWCFVANFVLGNDLDEREASKEQYAAIREELEALSNEDFEKIFPDTTLFKMIFSPTVTMHFVVLGNAENTFGISFYRETYGPEEYLAMVENDKPEVAELIGTLSNTISFYYDYKERDFVAGQRPMDLENPYGNDCRYSSLSIKQTRFANNFLTESAAHLVLYALKKAHYVLTRARNYVKRHMNQGVPTRFEYDSKYVSSSALTIYPDDLICRDPSFYVFPHFGFHKHLFPVFTGKDNKTYHLSARAISCCADEAKPDDFRFSTSASIVTLVEEKSETITEMFVLARKAGESMVKAFADSVTKQIRSFEAPKKILVNSDVEMGFAKIIYANAIEEQGTVIVKTNRHLISDEAIDMAVNSLQQDDDFFGGQA